ncbi:aldo/keto reductase [Microlunatus speluncae]|uniref:aldo/keto reductase n=1 Tax=Microlunatus speluncae TaxID=2594267 RepID=UPI001266467C|nr:aldo/keto reductase [Microlunatus speluncae]
MIPSIELNQGVAIPQLGYGVFQVPPDETQAAVEQALAAGYRHIDTAAAYYNEAAVGAAIKASGLPRGELFVTTKLRNGDQGYDSARRAYADSLDRLGLDRIDLYLVHWPYPSAGRYVDAWRALAELQRGGEVRAVGVSNFLVEHLDALAAASDLTPAVNQIELHPTFQQAELVTVCRQRGIAIESYSPLGRGADLTAPAVTAIAAAHGVDPARVILRWQLQSGFIAIPKSNTPERIASNADLWGFELSDAEVAAITGLEAGQRTGGDPATFALSQIR